MISDLFQIPTNFHERVNNLWKERKRVLFFFHRINAQSIFLCIKLYRYFQYFPSQWLISSSDNALRIVCDKERVTWRDMYCYITLLFRVWGTVAWSLRGASWTTAQVWTAIKAEQSALFISVYVKVKWHPSHTITRPEYYYSCPSPPPPLPLPGWDAKSTAGFTSAFCCVLQTYSW